MRHIFSTAVKKQQKLKDRVVETKTPAFPLELITFIKICGARAIFKFLNSLGRRHAKFGRLRNPGKEVEEKTRSVGNITKKWNLKYI